MNRPKLSMCNFLADLDQLKDFAIRNGFDGVDWSFEIKDLPQTPRQESDWVNRIADLAPLEIRYHCPFEKVDLGHHDLEEVKAADALFRRIIRLVSKAGAEYLSIHVGLGHDTTKILSWDATIDNLRNLVQYAAERGVKICLENLAWGWTSKPNLFEKLIRRSGAGVTFDVGHAHACEVVNSQQYTVEDFVSPHQDRVFNAHIYHTEISGIGHLPPQHLSDIRNRLDLLHVIGCRWWVLEIREAQGLLKTKEIITQYLASHLKN